MILDGFRQKFNSAIRIYGILLDLIHQQFGWNLAVPVLAGLGGLAAQVFSVSLIFHYAKLLTSGNLFHLGPYTFEPHHSLVLLLMFCAVGLCSLLLWSALSYFYNTECARYSVLLEGAVLRETLNTVGRSGTLAMPAAADISPENSVLLMAMGDSRSIGRALLAILQGTVPLLTAVAGVCVLFYYNWYITLSIIPFGIGYLFYLYRLNLESVEYSREFERQSTSVRLSIWEFVFAVRLHSKPHDMSKHWSNDTASDEMRGYLDVYKNIVLLPTKSAFINDLFLSFGLVGILFIFSYLAILKQSHWSDIAVYLVALRYTVNSLKGTTGKIAAINRFTPQLDRFYRFQKSVPKEREKAKIHLPSFVSIVYSDQAITRLVLGTVADQISEHLKLEKSLPAVLIAEKDGDAAFTKIVEAARNYNFIFLTWSTFTRLIPDQLAELEKILESTLLVICREMGEFDADFALSFVCIRNRIVWAGPSGQMPEKFKKLVETTKDPSSFDNLELSEID